VMADLALDIADLLGVADLACDSSNLWLFRYEWFRCL
jgi:hypothetical protein